jgi:multidrug efflux pump
MVVAPWGERERTFLTYLPEVQQGLGTDPRYPNVRRHATGPARRGQFPVEFVLAATEEPEKILEFAQQLQLKAIQSGMFAFPPIIDVKIDQPQAEIVIDRDKAADLGLNLQQVGGDLASLVGGNFVNRFNIAGRSYKVIPQIQRVDRLTAEQLNASTSPDRPANWFLWAPSRGSRTAPFRGPSIAFSSSTPSSSAVCPFAPWMRPWLPGRGGR